ncbi:MAG TPA: DUF4058 family protein [Urbifossiella sp.]|nr:DUF4058 family protein [Urbifossiella sp.]
MPLRDHFAAPVSSRVPWESLHGGWIARLAEQLNSVMPPGFYALDRMRVDGSLELDVGSAEDPNNEPSGSGTDGGGGTAVAAAPVYTPPAARASWRYSPPDVTEIRVFTDRGGRKVVAAVELVSPRNKDRPDARDGFVAKCVDYLSSGVALVVVDVVTTRRANLHNLLARALRAPAEVEMADDDHLYASAYRPTGRGGKAQIEVWTSSLGIGGPLPTMPLRLVGDVFVPVELEPTYTATCAGRRLV